MTRLHHVNVVVPVGCTDETVGFWVLLGLTRVPKPSDVPGAWFTFADGVQQLHVSERDGSPHPEQHVAVVVDDLDAMVTALREEGHPFERKPDLLGVRRGVTADPYGNAVELLESADPLGPLTPDR